MNKRRRPQQVKLRLNHPHCMHRKMCKVAQKTVHSNMLKNRNISNIKQLIFGMPVAFISGTGDQASRGRGSETRDQRPGIGGQGIR
jgi:hypothetical protein